MKWNKIEDGLPEKGEYDWVLVQVKLIPEGWYSVPCVTELRNGVWYADLLDTPLEETLNVKVTHWADMQLIEGLNETN